MTASSANQTVCLALVRQINCKSERRREAILPSLTIRIYSFVRRRRFDSTIRERRLEIDGQHRERSGLLLCCLLMPSRRKKVHWRRKLLSDVREGCCFEFVSSKSIWSKSALLCATKRENCCMQQTYRSPMNLNIKKPIVFGRGVRRWQNFASSFHSLWMKVFLEQRRRGRIAQRIFRLFVSWRRLISCCSVKAICDNSWANAWRPFTGAKIVEMLSVLKAL